MSFWRVITRSLRPLPELFADSEDGFVDSSLRIVRCGRTPDGFRSYHVRARSSGVTAGIVIETAPVWKPATLDDSIPVFWGVVRYRSLGPESNAFVRSLAAAYSQSIALPRMADAITFAAIALSGNPMSPEEAKVDMKLFFESEDETRYAEVYTNLLLGSSLAEFREKDPEYRAPLLRALTAGAT